jgi:hypothetical protein
MADETREYRKPLFRVAGKNSFFEIYDNTGINKMSINIQVYDETTKRTTAKVAWYIDYEDFATFCAAVYTGQIDAMLQVEKAFPQVGFSNPPADLSNNLRQWTMKKSDRGNYQISVTEKERQNKDQKFAEATLKGQASFFLKPFDLLAMATKCLPYIQGRLEYPAQATQAPTINRVESEEPIDLGV